MTDSTACQNVSTRQQPESSPNKLLDGLVAKDKKQNQRLISKFIGVAGRYDVKQQATQDRQIKSDSTRVTWIRFLVCILGLTSLTMSQMSRMVLNQTITLMIDPRMLKNDSAVSVDGSCPWPDDSVVAKEAERLAYQASTSTTSQPRTLIDVTTKLDAPEPTDFDNNSGKNDMIDSESINTPLESLITTLESTNMTANHVGPKDIDKSVSENQQTNSAQQEESSYVDKFKWSISKQNILLGGFYYSYFFFMILGGRMAEDYGAKYVLLLCVAGSAIINLATPWMARNSFNLLVISRILMGIVQAGVFPGMYALIAQWLTMSEASIFAPLIKMSLRLGMLLGSLLPGILPGWPSVYYTTGVLSFIWSILWIFLATSTPQENKWVSKEELEHILKKKRRPEQIEMSSRLDSKTSSDSRLAKTTTANKATPWVKILTSSSVIGLIIVKLTFNYALDFLAIELPSYLKYVHHASKQQMSQITTIMFGIQVILVVFVGWFAKSMVKKRPFGLSKTAIRKYFQGTASLGMALFLFILTFNGCNLLFVGIVLQIVSFLSMFTAGGETMLPYDLSDEYPATIMAIANSVANLSGVTTTVLAGFILRDHGGSYDRWNLLIYLVAGANLIGGLAFALLVRAEPIDFGLKKKHHDLEQAPSDVSEKSNTFSGITLSSTEKVAVIPEAGRTLVDQQSIVGKLKSIETISVENTESDPEKQTNTDHCKQPKQQTNQEDAATLKQNDDVAEKPVVEREKKGEENSESNQEH